jgi:hypothetical protein
MKALGDPTLDNLLSANMVTQPLNLCSGATWRFQPFQRFHKYGSTFAALQSGT